MIMSAEAAWCGVNRRAAKSDGSPPSAVSTFAAEGCIACPTIARVPALDAISEGSPNWDAYAAASRSAMGDRQILPVQTNNRRRATP